ncbi:Metallo-dependent hydrolase [Basidiobolus meristosporus CBS 931.73]|uniref:Metallo-dependent hydrolase n=1 Tax=Basidiobolus meristosporus CBS 931.73 TaxID=1314790 RepID=A0A1Y1XPQ9_9FUNG|nr:Metallo-dependent hydrolase [Basidiobolus meristosporus CBS 931.73]|eukprot:ORX87738.1 Metallo-dependent hydrolase [Basidiobolus meristosporus CBS 931.73]
MVLSTEQWKKVCDAHCHPQDDVLRLEAITQLKTSRLAVMGTKVEDWRVVQTLVGICKANHVEGKVVPCFGIHPWYAHLYQSPNQREGGSPTNHYKAVLTSKHQADVDSIAPCLPEPVSFQEWSRQLRRILLDHPRALVGEVGLDRSARLLPPGATHWHGVIPTTVQSQYTHQVEILEYQLDLAMELGRGVSLHCVQSFGKMLDMLTRKTREMETDRITQPFNICFHSYGGSVDMLRSLLKLRTASLNIYFSFSVAINGRLGTRLTDLIKAVPDDCLLIESDLASPRELDDFMEEIVERVCCVKEWSTEQCLETTEANWIRFSNGG